MSKDQDDPLNILDIKAALEMVYLGCTVECPYSMGGSSHAELKFNEYEIRVILSGSHRGPDRQIHFRFLQRIRPAGKKRPIKVLIHELHTKDDRELIRAIKGSKEYLLGVMQAINQALKRRPVPQVRTIDDLLKGD